MLSRPPSHRLGRTTGLDTGNYQRDPIPTDSTYSTYGITTTNGMFGLNPAIDIIYILNPTGFTMGGWVNNSLDDTSFMLLATMINSGGWNGFEFGNNGDGGTDGGVLYYFQTRNGGTSEGSTQRTVKWTIGSVAGNKLTDGLLIVMSNSSGMFLYFNGTLKASSGPTFGFGTKQIGQNFSIGCSENSGGACGRSLNGGVDYLFVANRSWSEAEIVDFRDNGFYSLTDTSPPLISSLNCTSCNVPNGDTSSPYETDDTTPTFRFDTDENARCAVGVSDINYTTMGSSRNCTSGEGTESHICTLTVQDKFTSVGQNNLYISCKDSSGNEGNTTDPSKSNSGPIIMEIAGAGETSGDDAIELGITTSEIGGTATIYTAQQISARNLANDQFSGTFDKMAVQDNKRWAFNYVSSGESPITSLFNLTPVLWVLQIQNQTNETITGLVGKLINSTYP
ncbi:MAG: hypothetical protein U9O94_11080 [Nanoarchaeota archaeon]|nr:hypothetical protein [Nanoarchaeota archaeon]